MLTVSSSSVQSFLRCKKQYELQYVRMLDPIKTNQAVETGSRFHESARRHFANELPFEEKDELFAAYERNVIRRDATIRPLRVEEPIYLEIQPGFTVRYTKDLVYRDEAGWIACRDFKTVGRMEEEWDTTLDFQSRNYIVALAVFYDTVDVRFEFDVIRNVPPGTPHTKAQIPWKPEECYKRIPIISSIAEMRTTFAELSHVARDISGEHAMEGIYRKSELGPWVWPRTPLRGRTPYACGGCFVADLCKNEYQHGEIDDDTRETFSRPRKPLEIDQDSFVPYEVVRARAQKLGFL